MTKDRQNELALHCWAKVSGLFAFMCNPVHQGPNFNWERFKEMIRNDLHTEMVSLLDVTSPEESDFINLMCDNVAFTLVRRLGVAE